MENMFDVYKAEVVKRINAWEGVKAEDFQYDPEREQLRNGMKEWLREQTGETDEKALALANKKLFVRCMAQIIYDEKVKPNLAAFLK